MLVLAVCLVCKTPQCAGVEWHLLHVLDHSRYWQSPRHDYILLPTGARGASTRLRWWQRLRDDRDARLGWSLDDVLVGGMNIGPSSLHETFDPLNASMWEFHPGGAVRQDICGSATGSAMSWNGERGSSVNAITTCPLIVQHHYMLQFKVASLCVPS